MKILLAGLLLCALYAQVIAKPSPAVVNACLRTESDSPKVRYTPIPAGNRTRPGWFLMARKHLWYESLALTSARRNRCLIAIDVLCVGQHSGEEK